MSPTPAQPDAAGVKALEAFPHWRPSAPDWNQALRDAGFDAATRTALPIGWAKPPARHEWLIVTLALSIMVVNALLSRYDAAAIGWTVVAVTAAIALITGGRPFAHLHRALHIVANMATPADMRPAIPSRRALRAPPIGALAYGTLAQMRDIGAELVAAVGGPRTAQGVDKARRPFVGGWLPVADRAHITTAVRLAATEEVDAFAPFLQLDTDVVEHGRRARANAGPHAALGWFVLEISLSARSNLALPTLYDQLCATVAHVFEARRQLLPATLLSAAEQPDTDLRPNAVHPPNRPFLPLGYGSATVRTVVQAGRSRWRLGRWVAVAVCGGLAAALIDAIAGPPALTVIALVTAVVGVLVLVGALAALLLNGATALFESAPPTPLLPLQPPLTPLLSTGSSDGFALLATPAEVDRIAAALVYRFRLAAVRRAFDTDGNPCITARGGPGGALWLQIVFVRVHQRHWRHFGYLATADWRAVEPDPTRSHHLVAVCLASRLALLLDLRAAELSATVETLIAQVNRAAPTPRAFELITPLTVARVMQERRALTEGVLSLLDDDDSERDDPSARRRLFAAHGFDPGTTIKRARFQSPAVSAGVWQGSALIAVFGIGIAGLSGVSDVNGWTAVAGICLAQFIITSLIRFGPPAMAAIAGALLPTPLHSQTTPKTYRACRWETYAVRGSIAKLRDIADDWLDQLDATERVFGFNPEWAPTVSATVGRARSITAVATIVPAGFAQVRASAGEAIEPAPPDDGARWYMLTLAVMGTSGRAVRALAKTSAETGKRAVDLVNDGRKAGEPWRAFRAARERHEGENASLGILGVSRLNK